MRPQARVIVETTSITSDAPGFSQLARLHHDLSAYINADITIDFSQLNWIDGHLAAPMDIVIRHAQAKGNFITYTGLCTQAADVFQANGFLNKDAEDNHPTTMPLTTFRLDEGIQFSLYAKRHLDRPQMPAMTEPLQGKFFEGLDELFANSALHSTSQLDVTVCGQFFPASNLLDFVIADGGQGIPGSLRAAGITHFSDNEAIEWAMVPYHTTKQGNVPGGLGSKILREFVEGNMGRLMIASGKGFWCQTGNNVCPALLPQSYPGTVVVLEINTADENMYDAEATPDPSNIW